MYDLRDTTTPTLHVFAGDGAGHLTLLSTHSMPSRSQSMAGGDFNRDGKPDLTVVSDLASEGTTVVLG
jgi:hypothetical protein